MMTLKAVRRLKYIERELTAQRLTDIGYPVFIEETPVLTGNARRRTRKTKSSIEANYPYALRLDQGWSNKSPQGMTKPTIKAIREYIRRTIGKYYG